MDILGSYNTIRFALIALQNLMDKEIKSTLRDIKRVRESDYNQTTKDKEIKELMGDIDYYKTTRQNAYALLKNEFETLREKSNKFKSLEQIDN